VKVDIEDENVCVDCGDVVEFDCEEVEIDEDVENGVVCGGGISKISTISKEGSLELYPPPKNILFVDDVDASKSRG
jgi:hypothetical protein